MNNEIESINYNISIDIYKYQYNHVIQLHRWFSNSPISIITEKSA